MWIALSDSIRMIFAIPTMRGISLLPNRAVWRHANPTKLMLAFGA
jgi:hypothetical protein